jgi:ATP-binding cassette, subfamily B, bacterial
MSSNPKSSLTPLLGLVPFLRPYRMIGLMALVALTLAAVATLVLPVAFRNLIDKGFAEAGRGHIDAYFLALFAVAVVLGFATAARFYLVSWLGERVTADIRKAVYAHVLRMSPAWFETTQTGEVLSRLTTDTTLVQTVVGTSLSMGLRNLFLLVGGMAMLALTSPQLTGYIVATLVLVVLPIIVFGRRVRRLSKASQDRVADASAMAGEVLNAMTTVQAFSNEGREAERFTGAVETAFTTALNRIRARAILTVAVILLVFGAIVFVLWLGAQNVLAGRMTAGELGQFILYAVVTAGAIGAIAETWGEVQRAAGATERLLELLAQQSTVIDPAHPLPLATRHCGVG